MIKKKKGMSSLEVVLSFVIFISFLFFLFYFLNPFKKTSMSETILDIAEDNINKIAETQLIKESLNLKKEVGNCFYIPLVQGIGSENVVAKNKDNVNIKANKLLNGKKVGIENSGNFYEIYYSEDIVESPGLSDCVTLSEENYTIGIIKEYKIISMLKLEDINKSYYSSYDDLKNQLKIPENNDFAISISSLEGEMIFDLSKNVPVGVNVLAREAGIKILKQDADIINAVINIKVW